MPNVMNSMLEKIVNEINKSGQAAADQDEGFVEMPSI